MKVRRFFFLPVKGSVTARWLDEMTPGTSAALTVWAVWAVLAALALPVVAIQARRYGAFCSLLEPRCEDSSRPLQMNPLFYRWAGLTALKLAVEFLWAHATRRRDAALLQA